MTKIQKTNKMNKEIRSFGDVEQNIESRKVSGYAMLFDTESVYLGFYETISRGAITQELVDNCDVFARFDHDQNRVLARSNHGQGSLKLTVDERGLKYEFEAPKTALGDELLEYIRRGDMNKSSFCFALDPNDACDKWEKRGNDYYRTINKISAVYDVSPVWSPAYPETNVDNRSFNEITENEANLNSKLQEILSLAI